MDTERHMLLVEDDVVTRRSLIRWIRHRSLFAVAEADSLASGLAAMERDLIGAIVDVGLPDGDGIDLVGSIRERLPMMQILLITGSDEASYANRAHLLGVPIVRKPSIETNLKAFLDRVSHNASHCERDIAYVIEQLSFSVGLSRQQRRIIELMLSGTRRAQLATAMGIEETTVRTHVRAIVRRIGVENLDRVGWKLLQLLAMLANRGSQD